MKPGKLNDFRRGTKGFALKELAVTIVVMLLLMLFVLPWIGRARARARGICCNCNLKQIGLSFRQWGFDHNGKYPQQVEATNGGMVGLIENDSTYLTFVILSNELSTPKVLICPSDNRRAATDFTFLRSNTNVSYFVGLDAEEHHPQMFLSGDRNLEIEGVGVKPGIVSLRTNTLIGWTSELHRLQGNIGFADGSVQGLPNSNLGLALQASGVITNRLMLP